MSRVPSRQPDPIRLLVEKLVASKRFSRSPQQVQFLRFTVHETLCGRAAALKEYCIATEAFGRGPDFDPKVDTIVRVQAGNVRAKLKEYFDTEGRNEQTLIEYPVGTYVPVFRSREETAPAPSPSPRNSWWKAGAVMWPAAAVAVLVIVGIRGMWNPAKPPPVEVVQLTFDAGFTSDPTVSRDGKLIAYYSDRAEYGNLDIWIQPLDGSVPPRRLTRDPAHDTTPDISPDGRFVTFRSGRNGGGIHVVPSAGGEVRKITDFGYNPRFSPDGAWIAYSARTQSARTGAFIVQVTGGKPIDLRPESAHSTGPVWSPRGDQVILLSAETSDTSSNDWWVVPVDLSSAPKINPAIRTGAAAHLAREGFGTMGSLFEPCQWFEDSILFTFPPHSNQSQIWALPLSPRTFRVAGSARQVLSGPASASPRAFRDADRLLVFFNSAVRLNHIWSVSGSTPRAQLTNDASLLPGIRTRFSLSPDGTQLLFPSERSGSWKIWRRELATAQEVPVTRGAADSDPLYAPSGRRFGFMREENGRRNLYVGAAGNERKVSEDCSRLVSWAPDETSVLCISGKTISHVEVPSGAARRLFNSDGWTPLEAAVSPDGKWLAISVDRGTQNIEGYLARIRGAELAEPSDWIRLAEEPFHLNLAWTPDGNGLYYLHSRDGFRCLWLQPLENLTLGRPLSGARPIQHFHSFQDYPLNGSAISVAANRVAVLLAQHRGNLWRASVPMR